MILKLARTNKNKRRDLGMALSGGALVPTVTYAGFGSRLPHLIGLPLDHEAALPRKRISVSGIRHAVGDLMPSHFRTFPGDIRHHKGSQMSLIKKKPALPLAIGGLAAGYGLSRILNRNKLENQSND